jgi:hypothetical protein
MLLRTMDIPSGLRVFVNGQEHEYLTAFERDEIELQTHV